MPARRLPSDRIVVVGTDGLVVREILMVCAERDIPFSQLVALDDRARVGREISYGEGYTLKIALHEGFTFQNADRVVLATKCSDVAAIAARARQAGARVIDTSGYFGRIWRCPFVSPPLVVGSVRLLLRRHPVLLLCC